MKLRVSSINLRYNDDSELEEARVRFDAEDGKDKLNFNGNIRIDKETYEANDNTEELKLLIIDCLKEGIKGDSDDE